MLIINLAFLISALNSNSDFSVICALEVANSPQWKLEYREAHYKWYSENWIRLSETRDYTDDFSGTKKRSIQEWNQEVRQFSPRAGLPLDTLYSKIRMSGSDSNSLDLRLFGRIHIDGQLKLEADGDNKPLTEAWKSNADRDPRPLLENSISFKLQNGRGQLTVNDVLIGTDLLCR